MLVNSIFSFSHNISKGFSLKALPDDKILGLPKLKAFAEDKSNVTQNISQDRKHCGKRRKCWLPALSSCPTMFPKGFFLQCVESRPCVVMG